MEDLHQVSILVFYKSREHTGEIDTKLVKVKIVKVMEFTLRR